MTKEELLRMLTKQAVMYRLSANTSINRNSHMNDCKGLANIPQAEIDALLTDFINLVGVGQGVDFGLYAIDLQKDGGGE